MPDRITNHFIYVEGRRLHYRRCGVGPVVALFHASPVSGRVHAPFMRFLSDHFTTIAFDTPSNGLSEPLPLDQPTIEDYADVMAKALHLLGVDECATYGRHTGASIAVEVANRHPELVTMALTDGLPNFTDEQREKYLSGYLSDLEPTWDGSYYLWLWYRYRDQHVFWPWNAMDAEHRADTDVPDNEFIHRGVIEMLEAGNNYKAPYIAAFLHKPLPTLESCRRPLCLGGRPGDSLYKALGTFPNTAWTEEVPREQGAAMARELELLQQHPPKKLAPDVLTSGVQDSGLTWRYVDVDGVQLFVMQGGVGVSDLSPLVFIPPVPGAVEAYENHIARLAIERHVIAIDPLGCGNSSAPDAIESLVDRQTKVLTQALKLLEISKADCIAISGGASVAVSMSLNRMDLFASLTLVDPIVLTDSDRVDLPHPYAPDVTPAENGTHMPALWHHVRDQRLWFPYTQRTRSASHTSPNLDPEDLHRFARHLVKHASSYQEVWQSIIDYSFQDSLSRVEKKVTVWQTHDGVVRRGSAWPGEGESSQKVKLAESHDAVLIQVANEA